MTRPGPWALLLSLLPARAARGGVGRPVRWAAQLALLVSASCLVTSTQEFPEPVRSRPRLSGANASPPIDTIVLLTEASRTVTFRSRVSSEDNNEDVTAYLFVGDADDVGAIFDRARVPAGKLNDEGRFVELSYGLDDISIRSRRAPHGCYPVTMIVSHRFDVGGRPEDPDDADRLVWWVLAGTPDEIDQIKALGGCPVQP